MEPAALSPRPSLAAAGGQAWRHLPFAAFLAFLWFILCRHLSNEWSVNEQYSYGWFVPFFAAFLFWLRWEDRPEAVPPSRTSFRFVFVAAALFLLLPVRLFEVGNPDWRPLGWAHALVVVILTLRALSWIGGRSWLRHFAFPVCFILVAVPWITPIEAPIVQGLMRIVATIATEVLALLGTPAQLEGSVIRINSGLVGVNEACSGVRSLQTSIMIGLLFGELKRLSVSRRLLLLVSAIAIAFLANCARAFFLVWIAAGRGVPAIAQWHDVAGYAILGAVFLGTVAIASALAKKNENRKAELERPHLPSSLPRWPFLLLLVWLFLIEAGVECWYRSHERDLIATPKWEARWPESAPGFRELSLNDDTRATLRFDRGREATWPISPALPNEKKTALETWSMFFFRWEPGTTSILRARAHRPDICLPNTGWRVIEDHGVRRYAVSAGVEMPFRHFTFARDTGNQRSVSAHAFFCQREDRIPSAEADQFNLTAGATSDWSRSDRLRVVRQGLRNQGQQVLELVLMTSSDMSGAAAQANFAALVPHIVTLAGARE